MEYNVEPLLRLKMPGLLQLLGAQKLSWKKINQKFGEHLQNVKDELELTQKIVFKDANFHSILVYKYLNTGLGDGMFDWYRSLFESLSSLLTIAEMSLLHQSIYSLLIQLDKNYLNFIGELAVLNEIKKQPGCSLMNTEERIQTENNTTADFLIWDGNQNVLIEIVNIHLQKIHINDNTRIKKFIESKLTHKIEMKFINPLYDYCLQPVLWVDTISNIERLFNLYDEDGIPIRNVLAPFIYFTYKDINGTYEHHFDRMYQ